MREVADTIIKATIAFALLFTAVIAVSGCQTAGATLTAAGNIRNEVAKKETEAHVQGLCGSNFNVVRERFGQNDQDWFAILTICESGQNSVQREAP